MCFTNLRYIYVKQLYLNSIFVVDILCTIFIEQLDTDTQIIILILMIFCRSFRHTIYFLSRWIYNRIKEISNYTIWNNWYSLTKFDTEKVMIFKMKTANILSLEHQQQQQNQISTARIFIQLDTTKIIFMFYFKKCNIIKWII